MRILASNLHSGLRRFASVALDWKGERRLLSASTRNAPQNLSSRPTSGMSPSLDHSAAAPAAAGAQPGREWQENGWCGCDPALRPAAVPFRDHCGRGRPGGHQPLPPLVGFPNYNLVTGAGQVVTTFNRRCITTNDISGWSCSAASSGEDAAQPLHRLCLHKRLAPVYNNGTPPRRQISSPRSAGQPTAPPPPHGLPRSVTDNGHQDAGNTFRSHRAVRRPGPGHRRRRYAIR